MYVIFGATGNTGGAAARELLARDPPVRTVARTRERLASLEKLGGQVMVGDLRDPDQVRRALEGARAAYVLIPPNLNVDDFRAYQNQVASAVKAGLASSDCRHVAMLSSLGAEHDGETGPVLGLHHLENALRELEGFHVLSVRAAYFMENFFGNIGMVQSAGILVAPVPPQVSMPMIAATDVGLYVADRLAARDFGPFEVVNLMGPRDLTFGEVTAILGAAIGKPDLRFVQLSPADAYGGMLESGLPEDLATLYVEMYQGAQRGLLSPEQGTPVVRTDTPFERFGETFAAACRRAHD